MNIKFIIALSLGISFLNCKAQTAYDGEIKLSKIKSNRTLAKFEPKDGVLLFVGQELNAVGGLEAYNDGYLDHFEKPAGWTTYSNISPGDQSFGYDQKGLDGIWETADWGDDDYNASLQLASPNYENMALAIGLSLVNHEEKVADGTHDEYIKKLGNFLLSLGKRPVFLRIAYEFDGTPWNFYDKKTTIKAYQRMVDMLREQGVTNTAYVWQSAGFMSSPEDLESWYPGDDYVDWLGFSFFNQWRKQNMIEFARKKGKPVFIAEATPAILDEESKKPGASIEMKLCNPEQAEEAWQKWFTPFFNTINDNSDVVKAIHYINCRWDYHPMWYNSQTFQKIDARLHLSESVSKRWIEETSKDKYILSSPDLYEKLYNNDN